MPGVAEPDLRERLRRQLSSELGAHTELISFEAGDRRQLRGLAVCSGRVLSYVLDAESERLRTRPLFHLLRRSRA
jgi:hypothetical protein